MEWEKQHMRGECLGAVMMSHASFNHNEQEHASACQDATSTLPVTPKTAIPSVATGGCVRGRNRRPRLPRELHSVMLCVMLEVQS
ncbi:unnamed protein product [Sphagnum troendelagicum]|uniref:Uncharacterized protein n=1 Tax=Sphagnum troendelagicum TaxID=128251 RepID=A0ABP0U905_9BRYO